MSDGSENRESNQEETMAGRSVVYASGEDALFYVAEKLQRHLDGDREAIREGEKHLTITIDLHDEPHPEGRGGSGIGTVTGPRAGLPSTRELLDDVILGLEDADEDGVLHDSDQPLEGVAKHVVRRLTGAVSDDH